MTRRISSSARHVHIQRLAAVLLLSEYERNIIIRYRSWTQRVSRSSRYRISMWIHATLIRMASQSANEFSIRSRGTAAGIVRRGRSKLVLFIQSYSHVTQTHNEIVRSVTRGGQHAQTVQKENLDAIFQLVHPELLLYRWEGNVPRPLCHRVRRP
jgi:hypothetical protein